MLIKHPGAVVLLLLAVQNLDNNLPLLHRPFDPPPQVVEDIWEHMTQLL